MSKIRKEEMIMLKKKYYIGLDQGTTGTTTLLLDEKWNVVARGYKEHKQYYPKPGWVEHDPMEIWQRVIESVDMALSIGGVSADQVSCIGIDNQGETVMMWDKITGEPLYNAIVWQDRRMARYADDLTEKHGELIREKTGLMADSYFSGPKIKWIIDNAEGVKDKIKEGRALAGTLDTWLIWKMTHGKVHVTDCSTASRTMMFNIHDGKWDDEILDILGISKSILPEICDSATVFGYTDPLDFLGASIPISGSVVDQQAALFGQACFTPGSIKCTYGTGCFMLMNTGDKAVYSKNGLLTTVAWRLNKKMSFALDGGIYITGAATQWLRDGIKIINSASETEQMAYDAGSNGGVYFVPAFSGLAAPHWDSYARGTMVGITGGTTREHIVRATLESTAYQVKDNLDVMNMDASMPITVLRADGGAAANKFLMQFQADLIGIPVDVPEIKDTTALGAAQLAALGAGEFDSIEQMEGPWKLAKRYEPKMSVDERESLLYNWHRAVERAKNWSEE